MTELGQRGQAEQPRLALERVEPALELLLGLLIHLARLDYDAALACYNSPEYQKALNHARDASERELLIVETTE